jgi:murein DD-endopeptidase MepM/ murein hydrolase activator NlpD
LNFNDSAREGQGPRRISLLIGLAVATACIGVGAASAQTTEPTDEPTDAVTGLTEDPAAEQAGTTEPAEDAAPAEEEAPAAAEDPAAEEEKARRGDQQLRLTLEEARPNKVFWSGIRKAKFQYEFAGSRNGVELVIEVVKSKSAADQVVRRYRLENRDAGKEYELQWDGKRQNGDSVRKGTFYFRVSEAGGRRATRDGADGNRSFRMFPAIFPVDGPHDYWDGFGAGRGHQGQDIGARCGVPLRAAEPGKVTTKAYNAGGYGYYVVIDVKGTDRSEVYGHLRDKATVRQGESVKTGERIGKVGDTGNASGCHLHFEYRPNGSPSPAVTKKLRSWDKYS